MKRNIIKEFIWLTGIVAASFIAYVFMPGSSAMDINLHDTYIVIDGGVQPRSLLFLLFIYFITLGFCFYLIRVTYFQFKLILADVALLTFAGMCLYFLGSILFIFHPLFAANSLPKYSQPTSTPSFSRHISYAAIWLPRILRIFLMVILAVTAFMIGRKWQNLVVEQN